MIEKIKEENVWDTLKNDNKPVVLYGMGLGAEKVIEKLKYYDIEVSDIFASDEFVRGHSFKGYKVLKYSEVCDKYNDFNVVLCFASMLSNVLYTIKEISKQHTVFAPDVPVAGNGIFCREFVKKHDAEFDEVYNNLADERSKVDYLNILNYKVSGKVDYLYKTFCDKDEVYTKLLKLNDNETILDLGAYNGDTIEEFTDFTKGKYKSIIALEPDKKNFKKLLHNTQDLDNLTCINKGIWDKDDELIFSTKAGRNSKISTDGEQVEVTSIDNLKLEEISFIKMDIEGSELKALEGGINTIKKFNPKLYVCAYHRNEDLFVLPLKIMEINKNYKIYFRHSQYIPAWESNFYCIND